MAVVAADRGYPKSIVCDSGSAFASKARDRWAYERGVTLQFIRPGKPIENAYCKSFNGKLRDECLNASRFPTITDAQRVIEQWRHEYSDERPHKNLDCGTPAELTRALQDQSS